MGLDVTAYGSVDVTAYGRVDVTAYGSVDVTAYGSVMKIARSRDNKHTPLMGTPVMPEGLPPPAPPAEDRLVW